VVLCLSSRLIKGDGEVLEEIVSKERHKEINKVLGLMAGLFCLLGGHTAPPGQMESWQPHRGPSQRVLWSLVLGKAVL